MDSQHSIQIRVDSSQAQASLKALSASVRSTANDLKSLSSSSSGFSALSRNLSSIGGGFDNLRRATKDTGISNLSREISMLSRGMPVAARELVALASSFVVSRNAVALFAGALGSVGVVKLASEVQTTGNALLSFKIGIDSVATSSKESGDALAYIRDAATRIGAPLDSATESFKQLYVNMRSLGRNPDEIKKVFSGFQTALTSLHVSTADQKLFWREVAETYSQGVIHTRQAILSAGSHLPGMAALLQQALGVNGAGLHDMFKSGGLPLETWTKAADILQQRYGSQLPEAFRHSQQNIVALQNSLTRLQQVVFDSGFDSGLTMFLKTLQGGLNSVGIDDLGAKIGEAFRVGFTAASLFTQKVIELREPITNVAKALAGYAVASTGIRLAAGAVALLLSPLGAAAGLAALLASQWDSLSATFSGSDASFNAGATAIKRLTGGWVDLQKAIKGAIELYELANGLFSGKSWAESKGLAATAGAQFDAGEYGRNKGKEFGEGFTSTAATIFGKLGATLKGAMPSFDIGSFSKEWDKLYAQTAPRDFVGGGDYSSNAAHYAAQTNNDLTESLKKVWERLSPANKGLLEYKENLQAIAQMRGKLSPLTGKPIGDAEIASLTQTARDKALTDSFPAASRIQSMMETVKLERDALQNLGGNTSQVALDNEKQFLQFKLQMLKQHVELTKQEEEAVRALIAAQSQLQKGGEDGFTQWANSQKSAMDSLNGDIHSGLDSISNGIAKIVTEGKGKFRNLGEAIRSELHDILRGIASNLIKTGINSLMSQAIKAMSPQLTQLFGNPQIGSTIQRALGLGQGVLDKYGAALDDAAKAIGQTATAQMNVEAAVVYLNGATVGSGLDAFKPGSSISNAINPKGVGGILPKNDATPPLFSNPLPDFKAGAKVGGLSGIPSNSASLFGAGINPTQALGALPGFSLSGAQATKDALKTSSESISRNSVAEFGRIVNLQRLNPVAERVGVKPLAGNDREAQAWNFFRGKGYSESDTSKILGNIKQESSFNPLSFNRNDAGPGLHSYGLAQWNHGRFASLQQFAAQQGKPWQDYQTQLGFMHKEIQSNPAYLNALRTRDGGGFGHVYEGFGDDSASTRTGYANQFLRRFGGKQASGDYTPTGSIQQTARHTQELQKQLQAETKLATEMQKSTQSLTSFTTPAQTMEANLTKLSSTMTQGVPATQGFATQLEKLIQQMLSGGGGLGGSGGGGLLGDIGSVAAGLFSEGGYSTSPVSATSLPASFWAGAPHFAEGGVTGGGIPSVLHPGEAVVPLSRGRAIPVEINGAGGGDTHIHNTAHVHVEARDADSFRRSFGQIQTAAFQTAARLHVRNG